MGDVLELVPRPALSVEDQAELEAAIARHPAGSKLPALSRACPTCGQNASGAIGSSEPALTLV